MSTAEEASKEIFAFMRLIKAENENYKSLEQEIERDKKNLEKAQEALIELPKKIDRERKRNKDRQERIDGLKRNVKNYLDKLKGIMEEERNKSFSPNPLINLKSCEEILNKLLENTLIKEINERN
jgi:hypothetical protein